MDDHRHHQQVVDEIVKLLSTDPPAISLDTAQKELSRGVGEVDRIRTMLDDKELWKPQPEKDEKPPQSKAGEKD